GVSVTGPVNSKTATTGFDAVPEALAAGAARLRDTKAQSRSRRIEMRNRMMCPPGAGNVRCTRQNEPTSLRAGRIKSIRFLSRNSNQCSESAQIHRGDASCGLGLDVFIEAVAVGVDRDNERAKVPDPEFPKALWHQVFPPHLLDLFDLERLES